MKAQGLRIDKALYPSPQLSGVCTKHGRVICAQKVLHPLLTECCSREVHHTHWLMVCSKCGRDVRKVRERQ